MSAGKSKSKTTKSRSPQHTRSGESMPGVGCKRSRMSTFPAGTLDNQIVHIETPISQFPNFDLKLTSSSGTNNELLTLTRQIAQKTQIPPDDQILYYAGTERVDYAKRLRSDCPITLLKRMPEYSNEGLQEEGRDSLVEKLTGQVVWISDIPSAFPGLRYLSKNLYHKSMAAKLRAIDGECECKPGTCRLGRCPCFQSYGYRQCNSHCGCDNSCENKAMLTGSDLVHRNNLYLFYSKHKQWGLRTGSDIKKGQFVIEYIGEMVSYKEYKRRGGIYDKLGVNYQLMVNEHFPKRNINLRHIIDATYAGNAARFINHNCDPNLQVCPLRIDHKVPRFGLFAIRDIPKNQELCISYGSPRTQGRRTSDAKPYKHQTKCYCGSKNCRGFLPFNDL